MSDAKPGKTQGNNPELWNALLALLDDRMQFGLLTHLRRCAGYHFEGDSLFLETATQADYDYLTRDTVSQQLSLLASDIDGAKKVVVKKINA